MEESRPMLFRKLRVVCALALLGASFLAPGCGGNDTSSPSAGGSAGSLGASGNAGTSAAGRSGGSSAGDTGQPDASIESVSCAANSCDPVELKISTGFTIPACCADAATGTCGLDSEFLAMYGPAFKERCQPLHQPGPLDPACPNSKKTPIPDAGGLELSFPGCCRPSGQCGYNLDSLLPGGFLKIGLGCVDSSPFLEGGSPLSCGKGAAGEGGAGGDLGASGAAGAISSGGVAGI